MATRFVEPLVHECSSVGRRSPRLAEGTVRVARGLDPVVILRGVMQEASMDNDQGRVASERTLHDVNAALDVLTATLSEVRGCEYPRLLAREIQGLITACVAHERARQAAADEPRAEVQQKPSLPVDTNALMALLEAREAEVARLHELLHHGVDTIEAHTLTDPDGTAVMMQGDYQCISAAAIERWVGRAETVLRRARR